MPEPYAGLENPLEGDAEAARAGAVIYETRCQACHGVNAIGGGPRGVNMEPPPADLVFAVDRHNDDYLFWRIAEGDRGVGISSSMPSFSSVLNEDEIWQVITYLHQVAE